MGMRNLDSEAKVPSFPKWGVTRAREQQFLILSSHVADHSVVASGILDLSKAWIRV